jgi:hypothetical protein
MWAASGRVSALRSLKCWCADSLISSIGVVKKSYPSYPPLKNSISASRLRVPKTSSAPFPLRTLAYIDHKKLSFRRLLVLHFGFLLNFSLLLFLLSGLYILISCSFPGRKNHLKSTNLNNAAVEPEGNNPVRPSVTGVTCFIYEALQTPQQC